MNLQWGKTLAVILLLFLLWACSRQPDPSDGKRVADEPNVQDVERRKTVRFDIAGGRVADPYLFNPYAPGGRQDQGLHQALIEPLFILNYETGKIEPWLGTEMNSNGTFDEWTLILREGVEWCDGQPLDADDVVFTIEMLINNAPELLWSAAIAEQVQSVEKVDDLTVHFSLREPNPRFQLDNFSVRIWGGPSIVPKHIWQDQDPLRFKNDDPSRAWPCFTGPYELNDITETEFVYTRRDDWWGAKSGWKELPKPEKLVWKWHDSEEGRIGAMAGNNLDSLMTISLGSFLELQQRNPNVISYYKDMPIAWVPEPCSRTFELNHTLEPWDDPDMRWAVNFAIDRDKIVEFAQEGTTIASEHFFPTYPPLNRYVQLLKDAGLYDAYPLMEHNPGKARQLIEAKGYAVNPSTDYYEKEGQELSLVITTQDDVIDTQRIAQALVEQLQAIGINAVHHNEVGGTWLENSQLGHFEGRVGWQTCGSVNEPWASMDTFNVRWLRPAGERSNHNNWRWSGENAEQFSAIVDEIRVMPLGDPAIDDLFVVAMAFWMEDLPVIPLTQASRILPFNTSYWTNWPSASNNYIHPPTWWQHTHVIIHALEPAQ